MPEVVKNNDEKVEMKATDLNSVMDQARLEAEIGRALLLVQNFNRYSGEDFSFFVQTFGCQQNDNDSEIIKGLLLKIGMLEAANADHANLVIFNTCSVRANADDRFYGHLGSLKKWAHQPDHFIGVMGCMPSQKTHREEISQKFPYVNFFLKAGDMGYLPYVISSVLREKTELQDFSGLDKFRFDGVLPVKRARMHRALISIMSGCNNFCTYCIVPYARGREESRSPEAILQEIDMAVQNGAKEVMLLGQNVNSYGHDRKKTTPDFPNFPELLSRIAKNYPQLLLRFMTSHPKDISDELIKTISLHHNIEPHVHLPLQSGSDRILKLMNRHYDLAHYREVVRKLRAARKDIALSTDLIVGFPGETEADFVQTLDAVAEFRFDKAFTFIFSSRDGTPASRMPEQIPEEVVHERFDRLLNLQNTISFENNQKFANQVVTVLCDGKSQGNIDTFSGRTPDDRLVNFTLPATASDCNFPCLSGRWLHVRITKAKTFSLEGELVP